MNEKKKKKKVEDFEKKLKKQVEEHPDVERFDEQIKDDLSPIDLISQVMIPEAEREKDKIIEILFEHPDLRKIADISHDDLINISVLLTFAEHVKTPLINHFCDTILALSLSKDRKSREEVVEIYKTQMFSDYGAMMPPDAQPSRLQRLRDRLNL